MMLHLAFQVSIYLILFQFLFLFIVLNGLPATYYFQFSYFLFVAVFGWYRSESIWLWIFSPDKIISISLGGQSEVIVNWESFALDVNYSSGCNNFSWDRSEKVDGCCIFSISQGGGRRRWICEGGSGCALSASNDNKFAQFHCNHVSDYCGIRKGSLGYLNNCRLNNDNNSTNFNLLCKRKNGFIHSF